MASTIRACRARRRSWSRLAVGDLVGERVLEGVLEVGEEARLVEELRGLEAREALAELLLRPLGDRLEQRERHVLADHGGRLEQPLRPRAAAGRCGRPGSPGPWRAPGCASERLASGGRRPRSPTRAFGLDQGPHALLQEEGVALGPLDQAALQRLEARRRRRAGRPSSSSALSGGSGSSRSWRVVRLAAPAVLVLGPVVDEEQQPGGRQALHQAVEQRLGLGVDPVEILEDQQQRLDLALAEQQALDARRASAAGAAAGRARPTGASSTGTSRSARAPGGSARALGRGSASLPVTFSRIRRVSSRSSIWK